MVHLIAPIFGLVAFFGVATASKYSSGSESSVSYGAGAWSTPSSPAYTGMPSTKKGQKDYGGAGKKKSEGKKGSHKSSGSGSGYSNWNQGYNDCVQQCNANYGQLPSTTTTYEPPTKTDSYNGGATHTIMVAPTQGVLRYVPFAMNASTGDTIKFVWGANNHTVTKSSALLPCNKSSVSPFASGTQDKDFVFNLVVNDTQPIYFYCGTPTHCQKGMFAMINPPSNGNVSTSMGSMMPSIVANYSGVAAYSNYTSTQTNGSTFADDWGNNIDLAQLPEWSHQYVAENVLFTRNFVGNNMETIKDDGSIDLSGAGTTPLVIPKDVAEVLASPTMTTTTAPSFTGMSYPDMPDVYQSSSSASNSIPSSASSLSTSGGYVTSASTTLILGPVAFVAFLIV